MNIIDTIQIKEPYCDVGCSNGFITNKIVRKFGLLHASGYDHSKDNIKIARERYPDMSFNFIDLNIVNPITDKFKLVTCFETLEHVGNLENACTNLLSFVDNGGTLLISVPEETGFIGLFKFLTKILIYHYTLKELDNGNITFFNYLSTLLSNKSISRFRHTTSGYGTHFGFDHHTIDIIFTNININYKKYIKNTTIFYRIDR